MGKVIGYFDLFSRFRTTTPAMHAGSGKNPPSLGWQFLLYVALVLGVLAKGALEWMTGKAPNYVVSWPKLVLALVTAIIAFPAAYKQSMDDNGPGTVQLCATFVLGFGWKSLVDTAS